MWPPVQASFQDSTFASAAHISKLRCPHDSIRKILDTVAICFAVFFMTAPLSQAIDVCGTPAKVRYVNPINLLCFYLNCMTQLAYGLFLPVPPVVPCNAYGVGVAIFSTSACWWFARKEQHAINWDRTAAIGTLLAVLLSATIFAFAALESAADVGVLGMLVGIIMYGAPLSSMKEVLKTKSSETLPVMQSFLGFLNSSCWFTVGVRTGKVPVWGPNVIGMMLSLLQLALILKYPAKTGGPEQQDFIPVLAEHSLADIARVVSADLAERLADGSESISDFMKRSSQDLSSFFSPNRGNEYISLDGEEPMSPDKKKLIEECPPDFA